MKQAPFAPQVVSHASRVHVLMPDAEAERFEAYCKEKGFKKSTLIVRLIREHLDREQFQVQRDMFRKPARPELKP